MKVKREKTEKVALQEIKQYPLFPDEVEKVVGLAASPRDVFEDFNRLLKDGWCVELMQDSRSENITALCKCSRKGHPSAGIGFYAKGDTVLSTMACAVYKIEVLGDKDPNLFFVQRVTNDIIG